MTAFALMNFSEEFYSRVLFHTPLKNSDCTSVYHLVVDDGVCTRPALYPPSFIFLRRKDSFDQKISDFLCPCWGADNHHDRCLLGYNCFFNLGLCCLMHLGDHFRTTDCSPWHAIGSP